MRSISSLPRSPVVSVTMPAYNAERYIERSIASILAQSFTDLELLIVDDCSTDATRTIVELLRASDERIRILDGSHEGIAVARNLAARHAVGSYVAVLDADDLATPDRFAVQVAYLASHPEVVAVGGQGFGIDADGLPIAPLDVPLTHEEIDAAHMRGDGAMVIHSASMIRREVLATLGGYRTSLPQSEDYDLWLRLAEVGRLANLPDVVVHYRMHTASITNQRNSEQLRCHAAALADARWRRGLPAVSAKDNTPGSVPPGEAATPAQHEAAEPELSPGEMAAKTHRWYAGLALDAGNVATARKHAWHALCSLPFSAKSWHSIERAYRGTWLGAAVSVGIRAWERTLGRFRGSQR